MKYTSGAMREGEGINEYLRRCDRERLEHVAKKVGLMALDRSSDTNLIGRILDNLTEQQKEG